MRLFALVSFIALFVLSVSAQDNQMFDGQASPRQEFDSMIRPTRPQVPQVPQVPQNGGNVDTGVNADAPLDDIPTQIPPRNDVLQNSVRGQPNLGNSDLGQFQDRQGSFDRGQNQDLLGSADRGINQGRQVNSDLGQNQGRQVNSDRGQNQGRQVNSDLGQNPTRQGTLDRGQSQGRPGSSGRIPPRPAGRVPRPPIQSNPEKTTNICNPVTGLRAQNGGIYATLLSRMGVQGGNCGGSGPSQEMPQGSAQGYQGNSQGLGPVNPITGIRAQQGGIYATLLNNAGMGGSNQAGPGIGLFGSNPLVQLINANGGILATAEDQTNLATTAGPAPMPAWAIAGVVLLTLVGVALFVVIVQLALLIRRS